jgi:hypothetical protein
MLLQEEDVIWVFGKFRVSRELKGLSVKLKKVKFGPLL